MLDASSRVADDGRTYYDLAIRMASYGSRNPYSSTQAEVRFLGEGLLGRGTQTRCLGVLLLAGAVAPRGQQDALCVRLRSNLLRWPLNPPGPTVCAPRRS